MGKTKVPLRWAIASMAVHVENTRPPIYDSCTYIGAKALDKPIHLSLNSLIRHAQCLDLHVHHHIIVPYLPYVAYDSRGETILYYSAHLSCYNILVK
jgi:hypothetical protein